MGGASVDIGRSIALDASGNVYTSGSFRDTADFNPDTGTFNMISAGGRDIFVSKLDASGNFLWAKRFGDSGWNDYGYSIAVDASGNVYTTGTFEGTPDFDPGAGTFNMTSAGSTDIFVHKMSQCSPTSSTITLTACDSYTSPSTNYTWTVNGTYVDSIPNATGCDSVITVNLTINNATSSTISPTVCNSYVSPSSSYTWTASGTYMDTIPNAIGCDSVITVNLTINATSSTISPTACDSYTVPSGDETYTVSGTYMDTIPNTAGCDSVITVNLTINSTSATISPTVCNSYTVPSGDETYTVSGTHVDTIPNTAGCDSVMTINLTVNNSTTSTISLTACDDYTSPSGNYTWIANGNYTDTIPNAVGCDSVMTINLIVNNTTTSAISPTACNSYTSPSTNYTWTASGTYMDTIPNAGGCDSVITVNLTINATSSTISPMVCESYTSPSANYTWTVSGIYMDTIPNTVGCDSVITVNLTINNVDTSVTQSGDTLTANASGAIYQWLDCNNSYTLVSGETNQSFTVTTSGSYSVEVTQNGCTDTSACYSITTVGILENTFGSALAVFPNPTSGNLVVDLGRQYGNVTVKVKNIKGQLISTTSFGTTSRITFGIVGATGFYFVDILTTEGKSATLKVMKN